MTGIVTQGALEFRDHLPDGGALLGLDLGTQTIGTAFCDAGWRFASPGKTIRRGKFMADKALLATLITERAVKGIVIGLPLNMDGSEGPRSQSSRAYARNLAALGLPVLLWDERWSTAGAERDLIAQVPAGRRAEPEEVAYLVAFLASSEADFITGQIISPNGGEVI